MRILVFQHVRVEHPGVFRDLWEEAGHQWTAVELDEGESIPSFDRFDVLVAMGGPMDVWDEARHPWLRSEKAAIRHWVHVLDRPFLGVCLGHQLLADALGGTVALMQRPEVGLSSVHVSDDGVADPVMAAFGNRFAALHWHGAEVSALPDGAVALASTPACSIQALRWGRCAYGIQCHIEITATTVGEWLDIPEYRASLDAALGPHGAEQFAADVVKEIDALNATARRFNDAFMATASAPRAC